MKKIKFKKPNLKEGFNKLKSLRWKDVKAAPKKSVHGMTENWKNCRIVPLVRKCISLADL